MRYIGDDDELCELTKDAVICESSDNNIEVCTCLILGKDYGKRLHKKPCGRPAAVWNSDGILIAQHCRGLLNNRMVQQLHVRRILATAIAIVLVVVFFFVIFSSLTQ